MKTWDLIKKRNNSVVFGKIFTILEHCVNNDEEKTAKYDPSITLKKIIRKKIIAYVKTHMHDLINRRDGKLENLIQLIDILKKSHTNQIFREKIMEWKRSVKSNEFALFSIVKKVDSLTCQ